MKEFKNKVAVITGAASGIGRSLAEKCAQKEMKIVLADIEEDALHRVESEMRAGGAEIAAVVTDVSNIDDVINLRKKTIETYKAIDLLFNNVGVAAGSSIWESSLNDCKWVIGVNLWGIIHCIREFVPIMLQQDKPSHIVNTSSIGGLSTYHPSALYQLTKHGIVALSEQLHHDLAIRGLKVRISVLCPGFVNTKIMDAERNRPKKYLNKPSETKHIHEPDTMEEAFRQKIKAGMHPSLVAESVFQAIENDKFYIFTHPEVKGIVKARMDAIIQERNPILPPMDGPK